MNKLLNPTIEKHLDKTQSRWRRLRLLQHTGMVGALTCAAMLALGAAMLGGHVRNPYLAAGLITMLILLALFCWFVVLLVVAVASKERSWLARHLENMQPSLLDRVNTLAYLNA